MIKPYTQCTPLLTCESISQQLGCKILFKCENFQKTGTYLKLGSFKARGAVYTVKKLTEENYVCSLN